MRSAHVNENLQCTTVDRICLTRLTRCSAVIGRSPRCRAAPESRRVEARHRVTVRPLGRAGRRHAPQARDCRVDRRSLADRGVILESGTNIGTSLLMLAATQRLHRRGRRVTSVDLFSRRDPPRDRHDRARRRTGRAVERRRAVGRADRAALDRRRPRPGGMPLRHRDLVTARDSRWLRRCSRGPRGIASSLTGTTAPSTLGSEPRYRPTSHERIVTEQGDLRSLEGAFVAGPVESYIAQPATAFDGHDGPKGTMALACALAPTTGCFIGGPCAGSSVGPSGARAGASAAGGAAVRSSDYRSTTASGRCGSTIAPAVLSAIAWIVSVGL